MSFISIEFLAFALLAVLVCRLVVRDVGVLALNALFIAIYCQTFSSVVPVLVFVLLGYGALWLVHLTWPSITTLVVAGLILLFAWFKQYALLTMLSPQHLGGFAFATVGLSYILFRVLHLVIDVRQGALPRPSFLRYINYCLFFPNFVSGPVQRFEDFDAQMKRPLPALTPEILHAALGRVCLGIFMILVVSGVASRVGQGVQDAYYAIPVHKVGKSIGHLSMAAALYLVNIFANFAGYMHLVIGVGKLCGFDIPENFNKPYLAKNFFDLWARWHLTLSDWFKVYLFNPFLKLLTQRWDKPSLAPYLGSAAFFVTFLVMGVWHGSTLQFVLYGLFLGFAAMLNKVWQIRAAQKLGKKPYKELLQRNWYFQMSRGLTLGYFAVSLVCLWLDPSRLAEGAGWWVIPQAAASVLVLTLLFGLLGHGLPKLLGPLRKRRDDSATPASGGDARMMLAMALKLVATVYIVLLMGDAVPEFIYKAF